MKLIYIFVESISISKRRKMIVYNDVKSEDMHSYAAEADTPTDDDASWLALIVLPNVLRFDW